jgi:AMMECR1 domain-containing protein
MKTFVLLPVLISTAIFCGCPIDATENLSSNAIIGNKQGKSEEPAIVEVEAELIELYAWGSTPGLSNNEILVKHPNENVVFWCKAISGRLGRLGVPGYQKKLIVKPGDKFRWDEFDGSGTLPTPDFVEIIIKLDERITKKALLSDMTETECVEFIIQNGIEIPDGFIDDPELGALVKRIIQAVERDPNAGVAINGVVLHNFVKSIRVLVNEYYGTDQVEENIIGYAVIGINQIRDLTYNAVVLKSVLFPQVDGEYQHVSEEYVEAAIAKIKDEANGNPEEPAEPAIVEVEAELIELNRWMMVTSAPYNVIMVKHPNENAVFECKAIDGRLWLLGPEYQKNLSVKPGDKFRWDEFNVSGPLLTHDFVEIIIKMEKNLIGYAVIEINRIASLTYNAVVLKSVLFPQIDGEYQNVSEEYVEAAIEKIKDEAKDKPEEPGEPAIVEEEADLIGFHRWFFSSGVTNNVIMVKHPNENAVFECKAISCILLPLGPEYQQDNPSASPGEKYNKFMWWIPTSNGYGQLPTHDFVEIVIKLEENIIGYAVIGINQVRDLTYNAVVLKSVLFPQVDGEYQNVNEEYVEAAIEKIKNEINGKPEEPGETAIVEEEADLIELNRWMMVTSAPFNEILVKHPNENTVFECKVINGIFCWGEKFPKNINVSPRDGFTQFMWWVSGPLPAYDFVEIVIKLEENIIGYAVIGINQVRDLTYNAVVLKSVLFPQVDGEYQNVSEEYVKAAIEKIKDETNGGDL